MKNINKQTWQIIGSYMDDDTREQVHAELAPCTEREFMRRYLELDPEFADLLMNEFGIDHDEFVVITKDIEDLAERIRLADNWNPRDCAKLCEYAGILDKWNEAQGGDFEDIVYQAAYILGVEVL